MDHDAVEREVFKQAISLHKAKRFEEAARLYNALLNKAPFEQRVLFLLGDLYLRTEQTGLAINLLSSLLHLEPKDADAWINLGIGYRMEDMRAQAEACWNKSIELIGDSADACSNMAGLYADCAQPEKALHWLERTLKIDPDMVEAHWQRGLALLTLRDYERGWPEYEYRLKLEHFDTREQINAPTWDFTRTGHLFIHGEQGIGDEIMFLSCLDEILPLAEHVTLEVNAAVAGIARATWPQVRVVTDVEPGNYTAKVALGSLAARLRRSEAAFPGQPYLKPPGELVERYRSQLRALGPGPYLALAWYGGAKRTRVEERSMRVENLAGIMSAYTCVSGQYEHNNPYVKQAREHAGLVKLSDESSGTDMLHQAALFSAVDAVVTVQQTAAHVAGAVGAPCYVMVNARPHWRYHLTGQMPWYRSVELIRQQEQGNWEPVIKQVEARLADRYRRAA